MTPRAGVKTTPAIETRLLGPPIPSGGPFFFWGLAVFQSRFFLPDQSLQ